MYLPLPFNKNTTKHGFYSNRKQTETKKMIKMVNIFQTKNCLWIIRPFIISLWWWPVPLAQSFLGMVKFSLTFWGARKRACLFFFPECNGNLGVFVVGKWELNFVVVFFVPCENLGFRDDWDKSLSHGQPFYQTWKRWDWKSGWGRCLLGGIPTTTVLREAGEMLWTWSRKKCVPMIDLECP